MKFGLFLFFIVAFLWLIDLAARTYACGWVCLLVTSCRNRCNPPICLPAEWKFYATLDKASGTYDALSDKFNDDAFVQSELTCVCTGTTDCAAVVNASSSHLCATLNQYFQEKQAGSLSSGDCDAPAMVKVISANAALGQVTVQAPGDGMGDKLNSIRRMRWLVLGIVCVAMPYTFVLLALVRKTASLWFFRSRCVAHLGIPRYPAIHRNCAPVKITRAWKTFLDSASRTAPPPPASTSRCTYYPRHLTTSSCMQHSFSVHQVPIYAQHSRRRKQPRRLCMLAN